jgi:hypothetical protein
VTRNQIAAFWLFGIAFWSVVAFLGRRAMRDRVASGVVTQPEVDSFARRFAVSLGLVCLGSAVGSYIEAGLGDRLVGLAWFIGCGAFLFWIWRMEGARKLVRFGPVLNMPLKRERRVRTVATVLAAATGAGNLWAAIARG